MISWIKKRIFGSRNAREVKKLLPLVEAINAKEKEYQSLTDEQLKAKTLEFKERLKNGQTLDDLQVEAFAVVKNTCRRLCGQKWKVCGIEIEWKIIPYDVQIIGGLALNQGKIAEMATGEGKTLVATFPLYLNALSGENVQLVTVNEYLAQRDSEWMGKIFEYLGLTVGYITNAMHPQEKKEIYQRDIVYGTASEFGFDYLRDNGMAMSPEYMVQRSYFYCIIDEVDSILIDEARTPLIISGQVDVSTHKYDKLKPRVSQLVRQQTELCANLIGEAEKLLKEDIKSEKGAELLYKVGIGTPKNRRFLKLMEDAKFKRVYEWADTMLNTDMRKEALQVLKEDLFYVIDEKNHQVIMTEKGRDVISYKDDPEEFAVPDLVSFYQELEDRKDISDQEKTKIRENFQRGYEEKMEKIHNVSQLLKAYSLFEKDVEYVVQDNKVLIVDEFTGRLQPGRRFSDGLHQALEAKENVQIEKETQTLATITIQNYFRLYKKLSGMTGTAETEADEFYQIYKMEVLVIPTNVPCVRRDMDDIIYKTKREKFNAIIDDVVEKHLQGRPVLLGTVAVDTSEVLSRLLKRRNIPHNVLNAKQHKKEAEVVAEAGQAGKVTIATNMAGRGTDIKLSPGVNSIWSVSRRSFLELTEKHEELWKDLAERGYINEHGVVQDKFKNMKSDAEFELAPSFKGVRSKVLKIMHHCLKGGLHIIGSERHESRRIDRQLRGRAGRQGDNGSSFFFISLEDDLMRLFGSDRIVGVMEKLGMEEGQELQSPILNRAIERAQKRVEERNFSIRKHTLEFDDVMNKQRAIVYENRKTILTAPSLKEFILERIDDLIDGYIEDTVDRKNPDVETIIAWYKNNWPMVASMDLGKLKEIHNVDEIKELLIKMMHTLYDQKEKYEGEVNLRRMERYVCLEVTDRLWKEHLRIMDDVRESSYLMAYGQREPLQEYKRSAFEAFSEFMQDVDKGIATEIFRLTSIVPHEVQGSFGNDLNFLHEILENYSSKKPQEVATNQADQGSIPKAPYIKTTEDVGRNEPCPCGSGKKYKKCCGR